MQSVLLDAAGHRRSPATMPGYHRGRPPRNKGERYPADPPTVEEIVAVMRAVGDRPDGDRLRALIVLLWRAGLRISEALDARKRATSTGPRRDPRPPGQRRQAPRGRDGPLGLVTSSSHGWRSAPAPARRAAVRDPRTDSRTALGGLRRSQAAPPSRRSAGVRRRFAPHQLRHAHAVEMAHEGVPLVVIQRQLGHSNLGITSVYLQGIDSAEIVDTVHGRPSPMISATAGLQITR